MARAQALAGLPSRELSKGRPLPSPQSIEVCSIDLSGTSLTVTLESSDEGEQLVEFSMPEGYHLDRELVMIAVTTLIGTKYDVVRTAIPLSERCQRDVAALCAADVEAPTTAEREHRERGHKLALNFSGGFDSMAALALLPDDVELVSLDFGGAFARERDFFQTFQTTILPTNFRQLGLALNSWSFMGVGPILLRDHLGIGSYGFGTILEATPYNLIDGLDFRNTPNPWFRAAGLSQFNPALGLTEVGTAMLLQSRFPQHVEASLTSLAAPSSEKAYRKALMLHLAGRLTGNSFDVPTDAPAQSFLTFGKALPTDFLSLYVLKHLGPEIAGHLVGGIPDRAHEMVKELRLTFYERLNTNFYNHVEPDSRALVVSRCADAGIGLYDETDWREFALVRDLIAEHHTIPGRL